MLLLFILLLLLGFFVLFHDLLLFLQFRNLPLQHRMIFQAGHSAEKDFGATTAVSFPMAQEVFGGVRTSNTILNITNCTLFLKATGIVGALAKNRRLTLLQHFSTRWLFLISKLLTTYVLSTVVVICNRVHRQAVILRRFRF